MFLEHRWYHYSHFSGRQAESMWGHQPAIYQILTWAGVISRPMLFPSTFQASVVGIISQLYTIGQQKGGRGWRKDSVWNLRNARVPECQGNRNHLRTGKVNIFPKSEGQVVITHTAPEWMNSFIYLTVMHAPHLSAQGTAASCVAT